MDYIGVGREEGIGFDFFERKGDGFLAERTTDLLEGEEFVARRVFDEVDVGEAALEKIMLVR